jgi:hypothetical protein
MVNAGAAGSGGRGGDNLKERKQGRGSSLIENANPTRGDPRHTTRRSPDWPAAEPSRSRGTGARCRARVVSHSAWSPCPPPRWACAAWGWQKSKQQQQERIWRTRRGAGCCNACASVCLTRGRDAQVKRRDNKCRDLIVSAGK